MRRSAKPYRAARLMPSDKICLFSDLYRLSCVDKIHLKRDFVVQIKALGWAFAALA